MKSIATKFRLISSQNIKRVRQMPCEVCRAAPPNDTDHIRTVGSGGGDELSNLMPLCRKHHQEKHQTGIKTFASKYKLPIDTSGIYPKRT